MGTVRWRGLDWDASIPVHQRHLRLWKHWRETPYKHANLLNPVSEHVLEACRILFTSEQLVIHPWFETQAFSWTTGTFELWWGSAGSGKSQSGGLFTLLDYITDPDKTFSILASTTKDMLELRSFASVVYYLTCLKQNRQFDVPFRYLRQRMEIVPEATSDEEAPNLKHKIKGVAVQQGTEEDARSNLQGVHTTYVRLVLDEVSNMRPAAMSARHNLVQCFDFKLLGMCNPTSIYDLAGQHSVPKGGWGTVTVDDEHWASEYGRVWHFDGFKSPGLKDPVKYHFLPTERTNAETIKQNGGNEDAPAVWTYVRGFPAPQSSERTVLTEAMVTAYNMAEPTVWKQSFVKIAALDPAFTSGGDQPTLVIAKVGYDVRAVHTICFDRTVPLRIEASSPKVVLEQLVEQTEAILKEEDIPLHHLAVDDSGTQSVADALEMKVREGRVYRCNYSTKPPEVPVSTANGALAATKYKDMITWMYFLVYEYAQRGQIRGLPPEAARQFCRRRVLEKQKPLKLEDKREVKKRIKRSPDDADACAMVCAVARMVLGLMPGSVEWKPTGENAPLPTGWDRDLVAKYNNMATTYRRAL